MTRQDRLMLKYAPPNWTMRVTWIAILLVAPAAVGIAALL